MVLIINNMPVELEHIEDGLYQGTIDVYADQPALATSFHAEAIEVLAEDTDTLSPNVEATNSVVQNRIDSWMENNDGCVPRLVAAYGKTYFVNIEVYAW